MKALLNDFEEYLKNNIPTSKSFHPNFENALQDMLLAGGKRFRPMLVLSVVNALNPMLLKNAMPVALSIELLHTYSLIHDDLPAMDNADLRRGHPTLHKSFDEVTAILVGDALNTYSFSVLANAPLSCDTKIELIKILSYDGGIDGMIIGQAIDCFFEKQKISLEELEFLHINKTGKLIAASLKMGAIVSGTNSELIDRLYDFGIKIGLLFQIQDDILDVVQDDKTAGKTTNNDTFKNSFVNLLGLETAILKADELASVCKNEIQNFDEKLQYNLTTLLKEFLYRHKV
ncbi:polyprenyl synthetase family protein [Arcobacter sp. FWKO B]|uniref:polyprenyl synthetase family protein n=1 Tax=Arcobacter sp. FWKO B TaxID=2593672 RepID=UPI0018A3ECD7|nr:farnesyl diphosphate synthase [Arcobacter sp. FWKO B]QOG12963.1 polyprenyl synthetase family protein [Arcobacter sp. FWKO B]